MKRRGRSLVKVGPGWSVFGMDWKAIKGYEKLPKKIPGKIRYVISLLFSLYGGHATNNGICA